MKSTKKALKKAIKRGKVDGKIKALILGGGVSGRAAEDFLTARGFRVTVFVDSDNIEQIDLEDFDFLVISPGVALNHAIIKNFSERNKLVISELELGLLTKHRKIVAITGTNGKTTVTNMIATALQSRAVMCGNVGIPVTAVSQQLKHKIAVIEASSFQLESVRSFRPNIAVITNMSQDHLERHGTMEEYIRCKSQIFKHQRKRDTIILNYDNEITREIGVASSVRRIRSETSDDPLGGLAWGGGRARMPRSKVLYFSTTARVRGIYLEDGGVYLNLKKRACKIFDISDFQEKNLHSIENILVTILVSKLLKVKNKAILAATAMNRGLKHRIQHVGTKKVKSGEVMFYNDSKATNIASCIAACKAFTIPVNLLVGGVAKGQNFDELFRKLPPHVENIFIYGQAADIIAEAAIKANYNNITKCENLKEATAKACKTGTGPRVVLLSPACSSFDQFDNYEHRGEVFIEIVEGIVKK